MRVVADSHILIFYLFVPDRLSEPALEALGEAEDTDGIVVAAATLGDLWYASHKSGPKSLAPDAFESLRRTVLDRPTTSTSHREGEGVGAWPWGRLVGQVGEYSRGFVRQPDGVQVADGGGEVAAP